MNPKYFHKFLGVRTVPPIDERLREGVEDAMQSVEMENFSFGMFNNEAKLIQKFGHYIVVTKRLRIRNVK